MEIADFTVIALIVAISSIGVIFVAFKLFVKKVVLIFIFRMQLP
jgi:hypothetical protein